MARPARANRLVRRASPRTRTGAPRDWDDRRGEISFISKDLPIDSTAPAMARGLLANLSELTPGGTLSDAQILISDLVSQRVRRGARNRRVTLRLEISLTPKRLRVHVSELGKRQTLTSVEAEHQELLRWELQIVAELADRWGMRHNGPTTLWFELDC
jgi:hypothetical protein